MILLLPCPTIKDSVSFPNIGDSQKIGTEMTNIRNKIKEYSNVEALLQRIQQGEVIMMRKIDFDNYLKSQVDLMRGCVMGSVPCPFLYTSYLDGEKSVSACGLSVKQQWAIEMVMSRYNICSIYHAAAYSSLQFLFRQTTASYQKDYKNSPTFIKNTQIAYNYFNQGYQPLNRLLSGYQVLGQLLSKSFQQNPILELHPIVFRTVVTLIACNLGYLKLQKYRLMCEFRSCKELAYSISQLLTDTKKILAQNNLLSLLHPDMRTYIQIGQVFFLGYCQYFLLQQHEQLKNREEYGFIKKQFQQMIVQNCVVCEHFLVLAEKVNKFSKQDSLDVLVFADSVFQAMKKEVIRKQYTYGINIHENKKIQANLPTIGQVLQRRATGKKLEDFIKQF